MKAVSRNEVVFFQDIPNVGKVMERDLRLLGFTSLEELCGKDPYFLYQTLERLTLSKQDPCVLDTYIAVCDFMNRSTPRPWFAYTEERKKGGGR